MTLCVCVSVVSLPCTEVTFLYCTYCQCIIQHFTVSAPSLDGTERSMARGALLASQPHTGWVCICLRYRQRSGERKGETEESKSIV